MNSKPLFRSLRYRMLIPLLGASLIASLLVAIASLQLGKRWAMADVLERYVAIEKMVGKNTFPITTAVLTSISGLTATELVAFDGHRKMFTTTLPLTSDDLNMLRGALQETAQRSNGLKNGPPSLHIIASKRQFLVFSFDREQSFARHDSVTSIAVLFDQARIDTASQRAASLPLATGLSTVLSLTAISILLSRRLVARMIRLQVRVQRVAEGDFNSQVTDATADELGQLGQAVDLMARQLDQLWIQVNRQQSQKLLYQLACGMAHQLRNTLTGSRLAMELHQRECGAKGSEEVGIAIGQLEIAEEYIQRLLYVGVGERHQPRPDLLVQCLADLQSSHTVIAKHLNVDLTFDIDQELLGWHVNDGPALISAVANLLMNALQAASRVRIQATILQDLDTDIKMCKVLVTDNGEGVDVELAERIFEPLVTSKPEGLGLGLAVVRQSAEALGGSVRWYRHNNETTFELRCLIICLNSKEKSFSHPTLASDGA